MLATPAAALAKTPAETTPQMTPKSAAAPPAGEHIFKLHGGHFYGPGPIVPDTPLPDGEIRGIRFDLASLSGASAFADGGKVLSDGTTKTNGNIHAGALEIGSQGEGKAFWLYAVAGGPNEGCETYAFDDAYNMVWTVDLALDPGFPEGIVRVDGFKLTTGIVQVPESLQTEKRMPGGYDKAGSLKSGQTLVGRVGDFDNDGFLDGIIVASANVPMQSDLLPGSPVGNVRGFSTDVAIEPLFGMELTLHGVVALRPLVEATRTGGKLEQLTNWLKEIDGRLNAARANYEAAFVSYPTERRQELKEVGWRLEAIRQMNRIPLAFLTTYDFPSGNAPSSIVDATNHVFDKAEALVELLETKRARGMQ